MSCLLVILTSNLIPVCQQLEKIKKVQAFFFFDRYRRPGLMPVYPGLTLSPIQKMTHTTIDHRPALRAREGRRGAAMETCICLFWPQDNLIVYRGKAVCAL
ncbi:hypothetical protein BDZ85DRAFT_121429 [Elsinoe ampelina]|uniref:Uncharacterized protein n=1 Tax=Elsinoe ampelina TaxID=302913 RepID=A0A6A6GBX8_9PEZI|nr:hypothetical protein BDZ85DRAFT_121429 [Elsinoe ampelina]